MAAATAAPQATTAQAGTVAAVSRTDNEMWVMAVRDTEAMAAVWGVAPAGEPTSLLIDSGSDEHLCRDAFVPELVTRGIGNEVLMDIQQNKLSLSGKKSVPMTFGPRNDIAGEVEFTVGG